MLHRGLTGLGWRHLCCKQQQATLGDLAITCQARIPDNLAKNSMRPCRKADYSTAKLYLCKRRARRLLRRRKCQLIEGTHYKHRTKNLFGSSFFSLGIP